MPQRKWIWWVKHTVCSRCCSFKNNSTFIKVILYMAILPLPSRCPSKVSQFPVLALWKSSLCRLHSHFTECPLARLCFFNICVPQSLFIPIACPFIFHLMGKLPCHRNDWNPWPTLLGKPTGQDTFLIVYLSFLQWVNNCCRQAPF